MSLLLVILEALNIPESSINNEKMELTDSLEYILIRNFSDYNGVEVVQKKYFNEVTGTKNSSKYITEWFSGNWCTGDQ